ncbi:integrase arm-type DNA-binding domain-containing protein [Methylobacterium brachiatum]|jgi:hypothetical protein|uniref:integrase arm-type DNA-binding domain-containing protein n=1 Tax=Methylobacterium brachiatum TaxID=269660 RepID=UPI00244706A3|nr:integrase arm-type DNA-binding domain-containing protein [Methylobacterium brachiatum]MDH2309482.1 integrase arm-type DNA-binding domain-containing protein [Methylobacterium brachiatum]
MAGKESFTREKDRLTQAHVKRAQGLIARDALQETGLELSDTLCQGLVLRVRRRSGKWLLKTRTLSVTLGDMADLTVAAARVAADQARTSAKGGRDPRLGLQVYREAHRRGLSAADAVDAAFPVELAEQTEEERRQHGPWQWGDLVDLFLEVKLKVLKGRWAQQYERHLRRTAEGSLARVDVVSVTLDHLVRVRDRVHRQASPSAAAETVEVIKAALDWAWKHHAPRAGLTAVEFPWWRERLTCEWASRPRDRTPTLPEIARTLVLAERHRALGGTAKETAPGMLAALLAVALTGQRAGALTGTLRATVRPWPERPGWEIWSWTAAEMKGKAPHAIPVPPEALAVIRQYRVDPTGRFLFPSRVPGKRVTAVGMTQLLDRMQGKTKAGKKGGVTLRPEANLFEQHDIRRWTPHDVRRTLAAYLDMERLGGAASAILAHRPPSAKGEPGQERELAQAITLRHYIHSQRLDLKAEGMQAWVRAVLDAYEAEKAALDVRRAA